MSLNYFCSLLLLLFATRGYATPTVSGTDCVQVRATGSNPGVALVTFKRDDWHGACAGALISNRHILVAGHCASVEGTKEVVFPSTMTSVNITESTKLPVSRIFIHPQFNTKLYDIAVLKLATPLDLNTEKLIPVCLPQSDADAVGSMSLFTFEKNRDVYTLHEYDFVTVTSEECQKKYDTFSEIKPSQICANSKNNNKKEGKAGGPMMRVSDGHYYIMGLSSFGVTGDNDYPEVFTRVWSYLNWIQAIVNNN